jgi:hypothetical protein
MAFMALCFTLAFTLKAAPQHFLLQASASAAISVLAALALRLIRPKELIKILREEA